MFASIFNAHKSQKASGLNFELVVHATPALTADSVAVRHYFPTRAAARQFARTLNLKPWNY
jgi:hypothetical protein